LGALENQARDLTFSLRAKKNHGSPDRVSFLSVTDQQFQWRFKGRYQHICNASIDGGDA
jgi:hypothetical protein